jgi:mannose-6-phosphate isomerase-like protein (cupin superfamily)
VHIHRKPILILALLAASTAMHSQTYGPGVDFYFGDWHTAPVHVAYGALQEQDLLTRGNPLQPMEKGAVLRSVRSFRHAILPVHATTDIIRLDGVQQVDFIVSGTGEAQPSGASAVELTSGCALLVPEGMSLVLRNTGTQPLQFYTIEEPTPANFHSRTSLLLRDTNQLSYTTAREQWSYIVKPVFTAADGLATLDQVSIIEMSALTIGRPKVTPSADAEIVWTTLSGNPIAFVANDLRHQPPGTAFLEIPDGKTPFSAIDPSENDSVSFLVFADGQPASPAE